MIKTYLKIAWRG